MRNPQLEKDAEVVRRAASMTSAEHVILMAAANPEDAALCREVYEYLRATDGVMALHRAGPLSGMSAEEIAYWNSEVTAIASTLLVVSTSVPSAEAQAEMLLALEAKKRVRLVTPSDVELPSELKLLASYLGEIETLTWRRDVPLPSPLAQAIARAYARPTRDYWFPGRITRSRLAA